MEDLFKMLPDAIMYLANGCAFLAGFYFIVDKRFDLFSDFSFSVMLVLGFVCTNVFQALSTPFVISNVYFKNILIFIASSIVGLFIALIRNTIGMSANKFIIKSGRRKTSSSLFWYDRLDSKDRPVWLRLINYEEEYMLQGVLLSIDEAKENPYLLLGYCRKYNLDGSLIDQQYAENANVQCVVRTDTFQEIYLIYDENSDVPITLKLNT